jgi:predicted porin
MEWRRYSLAVSLMLAALDAQAQSGGVQLYGRLNLGLDNWAAEGASAAGNAGALCGTATAPRACNWDSRNRVFSNRSYVGIRGSEDLGNGLKAVFQVETGVQVDSGDNRGQSGQVTPMAGFWATRDSFVGLDSKFGRLTFGRQWFYYRNPGLDSATVNLGTAGLPMANGGNGSGPVVAPVGIREPNVVQYRTPKFGGLNLVLSYVAAAEAAQAGAAQNTDTAVWGVDGFYAQGPFSAQLQWAQRDDISTSTAGLLGSPAAPTGASTNVTTSGRSAQEAWKAGVGWRYMPGGLVSAIAVWVKNSNVAGLTQGALANCNAGLANSALLAGGGCWAAGDSLKKTQYMLNWEQAVGKFTLYAQYGWSADIKGSSGNLGQSGAQAWLLGFRYVLSKRTWVYANYAEIRNEANSYSDFFGGSLTSGSSGVSGAGATATNSNGVRQGAATGLGVSAGIGGDSSGADPRVFGVGMVHVF